MSFNFFKREGSKEIKPSVRIFRKQIIEGVSIPAFIRNGTHFFVDIDIYEDGRVECWHFEDFEHFKKDLDRAWVVARIPDHSEISVFGLGRWTIKNGKWLFDKDSFLQHVEGLIRQMNPQWENIYKYREKTINGVRIGESGTGTVYKEQKRSPDNFFAEKLNGDSVHLFYKVGSDYHLIRVLIFSDDTIVLSRLENPVEITFAELEKMVHEKTILSEIPPDVKVHVHGLGSFGIQSEIYANSIKDKLAEIKDLLKSLKGELSAIQKCIQAHENYQANPTDASREKLKVAYENVPDHQKMYVGDMDTKDHEVRRIIYGDTDDENQQE
jgi:hypothetical protein